MIEVKAGFQRITEQNPTKKIERIARVCYKSEDKIADGTDFKMVQSLIKRNHTAMLEHADICIELSPKTYAFIYETVKDITERIWQDKTAKRCYLRFSSYYAADAANVINDVTFCNAKRCLISGNIRAWLEMLKEMERIKALVPGICDAVVTAAGGNVGALYTMYGHGGVDSCYHYEDDSFFVNVITDYSVLSDEERMLHETLTFLFTCDRGVTHELVRMREASFAQESTRYCNYSLEKHSGQISVIIPLFFQAGSDAYFEWEEAMEDAERHYLRLTEELKVPAQQARTVLPHSTKVDIVMTANLREWKHIFNLRACDATGPCHPQMSEVMQPCFASVRDEYSFAFGSMKMPGE